jgi:hypothetical protein
VGPPHSEDAFALVRDLAAKRQKVAILGQLKFKTCFAGAHIPVKNLPCGHKGNATQQIADEGTFEAIGPQRLILGVAFQDLGFRNGHGPEATAIWQDQIGLEFQFSQGQNGLIEHERAIEFVKQEIYLLAGLKLADVFAMALHGRVVLDGAAEDFVQDLALFHGQHFFGAHFGHLSAKNAPACARLHHDLALDLFAMTPEQGTQAVDPALAFIDRDEGQEVLDILFTFSFEFIEEFHELNVGLFYGETRRELEFSIDSPHLLKTQVLFVRKTNRFSSQNLAKQLI